MPPNGSSEVIFESSSADFTMRSRLSCEKSDEYVLAARWPRKTRTPIDRDPDSLSVSTCPRRTSVENSSPSRTTHSAAVAPPFMARRTMSWARERRSISSLEVSSWVEDINLLSQVSARRASAPGNAPTRQVDIVSNAVLPYNLSYEHIDRNLSWPGDISEKGNGAPWRQTGWEDRVGTSAGWAGGDKGGSSFGQDRRLLRCAGRPNEESRNHRRNEPGRGRWLGRPGQDGSEVKVAVDTNVLVRAAVRDDPEQTEVATRIMARAEMLAIALSSLCEFVWVLRSVYGYRAPRIAEAIRLLLVADNVETNRQAAEAGLAMLDAGGDFADGVIAYEGRWLGAEMFVSFDKKAVEMVRAQGTAARLL